MKRHNAHKYAKRRDALVEYGIWMNMRRRCLNPASQTWPYYGGRGIKVCKEWQKSFELFLFHVGKRPSPDHSLDRINNDGNYEPLNCRWATRKQQHRNKSSNHLVSDGERVQPVSAWAEELDIPWKSVVARLKTHPARIALTTPKGQLPNVRRGRLLPRRPITYDNRTQSIAAWARELGISRERLRQRLNAYPLEKAMTPPSRAKAVA